MAETIGYQDGITAFLDWYRKQPGVPGRGPGYKPDDMSTWPWVDKLERTLRILKDDHDAAVVTNPPQPPVEPPPTQTYVKVAPRVAYKAGGSDARYCLRDFPGRVDDVAHYDENGLCTDGRRSDGSPADCITSALEIDGREYCSLPTMGKPEDNSGSWLI